MSTEIAGVVLVFALTVLLAIPLGSYIARVFRGDRVWSDFFGPLERLVFRVSRIDPAAPMDWKQGMKALLGLNLFFYLLAYLVMALQGMHFWNPLDLPGWEPTLAFNTASSFVTNTNLQHYSGETGASYLTQLGVMCWLQFVSAATGIAAAAMLFKGLAGKSGSDLGNFYDLFLKSCTRILLPLSVVVAVILMLNGSPATLDGPSTLVTLEGDTITVATGPVAPMVAIKQLGTNGGGYFGPNSTHPFENANYLTNIVQTFAIAIIPMALVFAFGAYVGRRRLGLIIFGVMTLLFLAFLATSIVQESAGNPAFAEMGLSDTRNMEGKEVRFGIASSSYWGIITTSTSNGSVNSMHDSHTPLSGGVILIDMFINAIYGGVGVGIINFFVYLVIAVFIAGLMIGRTPELLGRKIEAREVKIAALIAILHPFLILVGTALASHEVVGNADLGWLKNPSYHGFSEMLYEFTSSSANNGSGFEGLGDNTPFWNVATGVVMFLGRFLPIVGPLAIVGSLAAKKPVPETSGSLNVESGAFGAVLLSVIVIVAALSFFPALALGPLAEYFSM